MGEIMKWRSNYIWVSLLVICIMLLSYNSLFPVTKVVPMYKSMPPYLGSPYTAVIPPTTNWTDIVLKIGSGLGGLMTLLNIIEKIVTWIRKK